MKYFTQITFGDYLVEMFAATIDALCGLDDLISDKSPTGKMRDANIIAHFRIQIVGKLFEDVYIGEAIDNRALVADSSSPVISGHQYDSEMI
jgi:hypothetical protein